MKIFPVPAILIDKRNFHEYKDRIAEELKAGLAGFDIETHDTDAHAGIKLFRKENADGERSASSKLAFDWNRMVVTGFSLYPDKVPNSYYINLNHKDVENRIPFEWIRPILDAATCAWIVHNGPFEITVMRLSLLFELKNVICTLQMAVSAYGPDEYDKDQYVGEQFGDMKKLFEEANRVFTANSESPLSAELEILEDEEGEVKAIRGMTRQQNEFMGKILGKASKASFSYNGFVNSMAYSYGLKKMVKKFFDFDMTTYNDLLATYGVNHMGELTGEQVRDYGADDSFWALKVFYWLVDYMTANCPEALTTFLEQENPMIYVYSDVRSSGMKVNRQAIENRLDAERKTFAQLVRDLKAAGKSLLPFPVEPNAKLAQLDAKWYGSTKKGSTEISAHNYRRNMTQWLNSPDTDDDYKQACQVSSSVSNAWAGGKCAGLSIGHYMQIRLLAYDLCQIPIILYKGKTQSDGESRGVMRDKVKKARAVTADPVEAERLDKVDNLLRILGDIVSLETRVKLYLNPYTLLTDPETSRMYPELSSMLATRRMACSNPNGQQLAKRGEAVYVRGYYEADADDEVLISFDWSQVELVEIGEFSGDPEFAKAYGQLPYKDLHLGAAADVLSVVIPEVTEDMLLNMHNMKAVDLPSKLLIKPNGEPLTPEKAKKFWRTEVGKGSNFNYWYSGALSTVGEKLMMTSDQMWKATELYRERFHVAEKWRVNIIQEARHSGFVMLPDGHRRVRWEGTYEWQHLVKRMFDAYNQPGLSKFGNEMIRSLMTRAGNQQVNSIIQGTSATLAKRSILRINDLIKQKDFVARFKLAVHDELIYSVRRDQAVEFIRLVKPIMANHPDIIKNLKLYSTASVGLNFEPFDAIKAPLGQIELDEAPAILGFGDNVVLNEEQIQQTIDYLFEKRDEYKRVQG